MSLILQARMFDFRPEKHQDQEQDDETAASASTSTVQLIYPTQVTVQERLGIVAVLYLCWFDLRVGMEEAKPLQGEGQPSSADSTDRAAVLVNSDDSMASMCKDTSLGRTEANLIPTRRRTTRLAALSAWFQFRGGLGSSRMATARSRTRSSSGVIAILHSFVD